MPLSWMRLLAVVLGGAFSLEAQAFPELVRYGYSNCVSCHMSPTGGGILTSYGRQISREVLSTWGREGEEQFIFGTTPNWLALQGELRTLNLRVDTGPRTVDSFYLMQGDLEVALDTQRWAAIGTIGRLDTGVYSDSSGWISRRHYLLYRPADEWSFRAGRFQPQYGLNVADHYTVIKQGLGFDQGTETYNLEGAFLNEKFNVYLTADFGRPDDTTLNREVGGALTGGMMLGETYKVGLSYYYGTSDLNRRHLLGPWGILGFTKQFFLLTELDFQRAFPFDAVEAQYGFATYNRLDYEIVQGLHLFGTYEAEKLDFSDPASRTIRYGLGAQFFPRPHFELEGMWLTQQTLSASPEFLPTYFLLIHYYL